MTEFNLKSLVLHFMFNNQLSRGKQKQRTRNKKEKRQAVKAFFLRQSWIK